MYIVHAVGYLDHVLIPALAAPEDLLFKFIREVIAERVTIGLNAGVLPLPGQAQLAPVADIFLLAAGNGWIPGQAFPAAGPGRAEMPSTCFSVRDSSGFSSLTKMARENVQPRTS